MLLVSFIYSLASTIGKFGIIHSNPSFFGITYFSLFALIMVSSIPLVPNVRAGRPFF